ncbi:unnamed protein product, partial [Oppiella nova]
VEANENRADGKHTPTPPKSGAGSGGRPEADSRSPATKSSAKKKGPKKWVPLEIPPPPPPSKPHRTKSQSTATGGALRERQERDLPGHGDRERRPPRDKPREDRYHQSSGAENYHSDDHSKGGPGGGGGERERTGS